MKIVVLLFFSQNSNGRFWSNKSSTSKGLSDQVGDFEFSYGMFTVIKFDWVVIWCICDIILWEILVYEGIKISVEINILFVWILNNEISWIMAVWSFNQFGFVVVSYLKAWFWV